jgi:hypothetical protein
VLGWQLGPIAVAVTSGGALLALLAYPRPARAQELESDDHLRAHLARARRRGEPVDVLVAQLLDGSAADARRMRESLRVTDSSHLIWDGGGFELRAMVDRDRLDRDALEARLRSIAGTPVTIGWSRFPEDGFTLSVLMAEARRACDPAPEQLGPQPLPRQLPAPRPREVASR